MKINVIISPQNSDELFFTGKTTVVIDVLRASTSIVAALSGGAKEIIPVSTLEFAMKISGYATGGSTLIAGERNTKKIEGFSLGNSPAEFTKAAVEGRSIILFTTNGTKAIVKAKFSRELLVCCFNNLSAVAQYVTNPAGDLEILCAGRNGAPSLEDLVCAGKLISEIEKIVPEVSLGDTGNIALALQKSFGKSIPKMLLGSEHGQLLVENGFGSDIDYCSKLNTTDLVPFYSNGVIKSRTAQDKPESENKPD